MVEIFDTALKNSLSLIQEQLDMIEKRNRKEKMKLLIEVCPYIVFSGQ
jgi:hypothetical protein